MTDIHDRFRSLDDLDVPDVYARARALGPQQPQEPRPSGSRRVGVVLLAFIVAAAGFGFVIVRFQRDTTPGPVTSISRRNGVIYFRVGGGDGPSWWESVAQDGTGQTIVFPADAPINHNDVAWSSDGSRIAFANTIASRQPGIYTSNPDGSDAVRVTDQAGDLYPSWSPDGSQIAFARADPNTQCEPGDALSSALSCQMSIYVMNSDGSNVRQLTSGDRHDSQPVWSPDGSQIAFTGAGGPAYSRSAVFVVNAGGSDVRQVSSASGGSDFSPSWSPNGTQLAFASIRYEDWSISVVTADGSGEHLLVGHSGTYVEDPVWSPDGTAVAFVGDPGLAGGHGIDPALLAVPSVGGQVRLIAQAPSYGVADIAWQPLAAGSSASVAAATSDGLLALAVQQRIQGFSGLVIAVMRPDGTGFRQLTGLPADRQADPQIGRYSYASDDSPSFSPDGRTIAFVRRYTEGINSLCMIDVDGSNFRVVIQDAHAGEIAWSPDGRTIAFYSDQDGGIHLVDVDGTNERVLWQRVGGPNQDSPSWSSDGSRIFYASGNVWVANADGSGSRVVANLPRFVGWVALSPDGSTVAFSEREPGGTSRAIWIMDADGSNVRRVTNAASGPWYSVTWSPDGSRLLIVDDQGGAVFINPDGTSIGRLTPPDGWSVSGAIAWSGQAA
jgi:Tol biopolymer transport system component